MPDRSPSTPAVFTPEAVASINRAYADAVANVGTGKSRPQLRHALAEHMMGLACSGVIDEERPCSLSVRAVLGRLPEGRRGSGAAAADGR